MQYNEHATDSGRKENTRNAKGEQERTEHENSFVSYGCTYTQDDGCTSYLEHDYVHSMIHISIFSLLTNRRSKTRMPRLL